MPAQDQSNATAGLIFPSQATANIDSQLRHIGKAALSIHNRLRSIESDAEYICGVQSQLGLPLVANERCGGWYVKPGLKDASAYFKSTDGHFGQWSFSLRRLNLQVLDVVGRSGGCIIVDSTRRGKQLPDALSKTVPIWCAVMNRLLFPEASRFHHVERLPELISDSEYSRIEARLEGFVVQAKALDLDLHGLRKRLGKPMQVAWIARSLRLMPSMFLPLATESGECYPMFLCMASVVLGSEPQNHEYAYAQGAADDSEAWAQGLTPNIFWSHSQTLLNTSEADLPSCITSLTASHLEAGPSKGCLAIVPGSAIFLGNIDQILQETNTGSFVIICTSAFACIPHEQACPKILCLNCGSGKQGSRELRKEMTRLPNFLNGKRIEKLLIGCSSGADLSVGVALAILVLYTDDQGRLSQPLCMGKKEVDKALVRKKLSWIMASMPSAHPSRATLNAVNSFLMKQPD